MRPNMRWMRNTSAFLFSTFFLVHIGWWFLFSFLFLPFFRFYYFSNGFFESKRTDKVRYIHIYISSSSLFIYFPFVVRFFNILLLTLRTYIFAFIIHIRRLIHRAFICGLTLMGCVCICAHYTWILFDF